MFCRSCCIPVCSECVIAEHNAGGQHELEALTDIAPRLSHSLGQIVSEARQKAADLRSVAQSADGAAGRLVAQLNKAQNDVNEAYQFYRSLLEEKKNELYKELEMVGSARQMALNDLSLKSSTNADMLLRTCNFAERLVKYTSPGETLIFKKLLDQKFLDFMSYTPDTQILTVCNDIEFCSNFQSIQAGVKNTFGYIRSGGEPLIQTGRQPPIARPTLAALNHISNGTAPSPLSHIDRAVSSSPFESLNRRFSPPQNIAYPGSTIGDMAFCAASAYEKWSNGVVDSIFPQTQPSEPSFQNTEPTMLDMTSRILTPGVFPPKSQIKRQKMIYHCKFGEFGVMEGQFTEPSGVAVNAQNDIIVADTNNHRIQIFDKEGRFKFQFGECGKRDGQLLYPNRVAVVRPSGDIIVTERSPTHQIQIYNQYGQFVRKFGANILQHPRGVTVDNKGRIIVVECKVMRVIIFDQQGNVLHKFGCSKHLEFPNGVVVNDRQEIFISDNRAHCVKVFSYEGTFLRQIGGEGITNYPIGVCINSSGEILIADNHNNFNLTVFTQDGQLVSALESKVKHAQCFDVALMDDGSVVLASKDYRLYVYRYLQIPPIGL
nr:EOG090X01W2 [Artemia franciscana]